MSHLKNIHKTCSLGDGQHLNTQVFSSEFQQKLGNASVHANKDTLSICTGKMERTWVLTNAGLLTTSVKDLYTRKEWVKPDSSLMCDWNLPGAITADSKATLMSFNVRESDDDGFITPHLEVISTFRYDAACLEIQHLIWVFPDAPGVRTQLRVKSLTGFKPEGMPETETTKDYYGHTLSVPSGRSEYLPLDLSVKNQRRYWGYYNNPGSRHDQSRDMLKEELVTGFPVFQDEDINWASGVCFEYGNEGMMIIKESHKCVNHQGHNTGSFYSGPSGLKVTGWGLQPGEIVEDRFRECWANWTIVYTYGNDGMQLALKQFDRLRYPVFPERDMMIINDTWGPGDPYGGQFAKEDFLLREIPLLADLGVDVLRIDDGWQMNPWGENGQKEVFLPAYPDGWKNINAACAQHQVKLGLWIAVQRAAQKDLLYNLAEANVVTWKVDFDFLKNSAAIENRIANVREIMKQSWMKTQFSFCPEYDDPRYGWYFAKEYGSIYFQNIQEALPEHLIMVPYHILRQHWLMCKYYNGNKLQVLLQNPKRVDQRYSDAHLHSHSYCFALGFPFVPVFFQSAQFLDDEGRKEMKDIIALYKQHRDALFGCYSFPVGETPNNENWAGFQFINEEMIEGYFLIFRELYNKEQKKSIRMKFLEGKTIQTTNLKTGATQKVKASPDGMMELNIENPADFIFLKYQIVK